MGSPSLARSDEALDIPPDGRLADSQPFSQFAQGRKPLALQHPP
jgi:hypothetical protein